jgi:hypothetical protein
MAAIFCTVDDAVSGHLQGQVSGKPLTLHRCHWLRLENAKVQNV